MPAGAIGAPATDTPERRAFYDRIGRRNLTPLWASLANPVTPEPVGPCRPASRRFADIRAASLEASGPITAEEAERRGTRAGEPGAARAEQDHHLPLRRFDIRSAPVKSLP